MTIDLDESTRLLDDVGWHILKELQADARISYSELGRRVGLSSPAVTERIRRMEDAGINTGYRADINPAAIGLEVKAILRLRVEDCHGISERLEKHIPTDYPEILECYRVTGDDTFVMKAVLSSVDHLQDLLDRLTPLGNLVTCIILSSLADHRPLEAAMVKRSLME